MFDCTRLEKSNPYFFHYFSFYVPQWRKIIWFGTSKWWQNSFIICMTGEVKKLYSTAFSEEPVSVKLMHTHICKPKHWDNQETPQEQSRQTFPQDKIVERGCAVKDLQISLEWYNTIHSIIEMQHMMCL